MNKTKVLYVPAGEVVCLENVWAHKVIVDGRLIVKHTINSAMILGKGIVSAPIVHADTIKLADLSVYSKLITQKLYVKRLYAMSCYISGCAAITTYAECHSMKAGRLIIALADIDIIDAKETIELKPKARGFLRTIFDAYLQVRKGRSKKRVKKTAGKKKEATQNSHDDLTTSLMKLLPQLQENGYRLEIDPAHQTIGIISNDAA